MTGTAEQRRRWREDAIILGHVGAELVSVEVPTVRVRLSSELARRALHAWQRDDGPPDADLAEADPADADLNDTDEASPESVEDGVVRMRAGTLALLGLAIEERGRWDVDGVTVDVAADVVGLAVNAADDRSRWEPGSPSDTAHE